MTITQASVLSGQGPRTAVAGELVYKTAASEIMEASWDKRLDYSSDVFCHFSNIL